MAFGASILLLPIVLVSAFLSFVWIYRRWRHLLAVRALVSALLLSLAGACGLAFYERYWIWRNCFNELGRCYDTEAGVMVDQAGPIWGLLTLTLGLLFLRSVWRLKQARGVRGRNAG